MGVSQADSFREQPQRLSRQAACQCRRSALHCGQIFVTISNRSRLPLTNT